MIVEDVVDTGLTLNYLLKTLRFRGRRVGRGVHAARPPVPPAGRDPAALHRLHRPDDFVVGYGFDHRQRFRNLPDIHILLADADA